jgi:hypothetical protein
LLVRNVPALNLYEALSCEVDDPNQVLTTCRLRPRTLSAVAVYPFEESPPLVDGTYFVRWQVLGLASVLFPRVLGQDSFTIKNGRLVR